MWFPTALGTDINEIIKISEENMDEYFLDRENSL